MLKKKNIRFLKTKTTKGYSKPRRVSTVHGYVKKPSKWKIKKKSEDNMIRNLRNHFRQKNMNQSKTKYLEILRFFSKKRKKKIIKNRYKYVLYIAKTILNINVMLIEIKPYQSRNTLIKLNNSWKTYIISKILVNGKFS